MKIFLNKKDTPPTISGLYWGYIHGEMKTFYANVGIHNINWFLNGTCVDSPEGWCEIPEIIFKEPVDWELKRKEQIEENEKQRINVMVNEWNTDKRAYSMVKHDDTEFFNRINIDPEKIGTTSQTGNDIMYYDVNTYNSTTNALKRIKNNEK